MKLDHYSQGVLVSVADGPFQPLPDSAVREVLASWPMAGAERERMEQGHVVRSPVCALFRYRMERAGVQAALPL